MSPGQRLAARRKKYKDAGDAPPAKFVSKDKRRQLQAAGGSNKEALQFDARREATRRAAFEAERAIFLKKKKQKEKLPGAAPDVRGVDEALSPIQQRVSVHVARL